MSPKKNATHAVYNLKVHLFKVLTKGVGTKETDIGSINLRC